MKKTKSVKENRTQKVSIEKRNMQKKGDKSNNKGLINSEEEEEQQGDDSESLEKMENIRLIKEYRDQLNEEKEVKAFNDNRISKSKESHENTKSKTSENIN